MNKETVLWFLNRSKEILFTLGEMNRVKEINEFIKQVEKSEEITEEIKQKTLYYYRITIEKMTERGYLK